MAVLFHSLAVDADLQSMREWAEKWMTSLQDRVVYLENRVSVLENEIAILKTPPKQKLKLKDTKK
jgi:hypothetical protein